MPLHTIGATYKDDAGSVPLGTTVYAVPSEVNALLTVPAGSVDLEKDLEFYYARATCYVLAVATQTPAQVLTSTYSEPAAGSIGVKVNSTSSPVPDAFTVQSKQPLVFAPALAGTTNKFTANVTKFYLSNSGSLDLVLVVKVGLTA